jgi:hypothetical protein
LNVELATSNLEVWVAAITRLCRPFYQGLAVVCLIGLSNNGKIKLLGTIQEEMNK